MSSIAELAREAADKRAQAEALERVITCRACLWPISVFEASMVGEHQHIDPDRFVCASCAPVKE